MLYSCGSNAASHLALGHADDVSTLTPTLPRPPGEILDLVSVSAHTLILIRNEGRNTLYGIGTNTVGQLGTPCALRDEEDKQVLKEWRRLELVREMGTDEKEEDWEPVSIGATWTSSIVVYRRVSSAGGTTRDASAGRQYMVVGCGSNDFNELGDTETTTDKHISTTTPSSRPRVIDVGLTADDEVDLLACGQRHVMLALCDGQGKQRVVGWGGGRRGEFDLSTIGGAQPAQADTGGKGKGKAAPRPATYPPTTLFLPLSSEERIIDISLGASHTLALISSGRVSAWGSNAKGQISGTKDLTDIEAITASWGGSYFLTRFTEVLSQGSNTHSQLLHSTDGLGRIDTPEGWKVEKLVAGSEHLLVLLRRGEEQGLWTGGWNEHGNLALGNQKDRARLERVQLPAGRVRGIWAGCASTWVWME